MGSNQPRSLSKRILLGDKQSKTEVGLLLATGLLIAGAGLSFVILSYPYGAIPHFLYIVQDAFIIDTGFGQLIETTFTLGLITIMGLAAIHAYVNEGYLPSLLLATAPIYGMFVFTVPGPVTGLVVRINENVVFAPHWAARHVLPNTVAYGTIGFLIGLSLRYFYQTATHTSAST